MDALTAAMYSRLAGDTDLVTTQGVTVTQGRLGQDPKYLDKPRAVFKLAGGPTAHHTGASIDAYIEVKVWGYEGNEDARLPACLAAAQRISELMLSHFTLDGGGTLRPRENPGWQQVEDTDPQIVHLHNGFNMRYWSAQRVAVLAS